MGWGSVTRVTRLPWASRDAVWQRIGGLSPPQPVGTPRSSSEKQVCCYALQGTCYYGVSCEYSHETGEVNRVGCQFGARCRLGHARFAEAAQEDASAAPEVALPEPVLPQGCLPLLECRGPGHDDSDPLWQEVVLALSEEGESVGDADLSVASRGRLASEGLYRLVDDDTADEWICVTAEAMKDRLEAVREKVAQSRRLWMADDLCEARCFWGDILRALRLQPQPGKNGLGELGPLQLDGGGILGRSLASVDAALRRVLELHSKDLGLGDRGLADALAAAQAAVSGLQRATNDVVASGMADATSMAGEDISGCLDEDMRSNLTELLGCLERCIFIARAEEGQSAGSLGQVRDREAEEADGLAVGTAVEVSGLTSSSEQGLNGQRGHLERYDEALGLWQLRLELSGTRMLLSEDQLSGLRQAGTVGSSSPRARSRSPRRLGAVRCLMDVAQDAAKSGDYVLVHHVVAWTGTDAKPMAPSW